MGKKIRVQKRGKGGSQYRSLGHRKIAPVDIPNTTESKKVGTIEELMHETGRGSPLSMITLEDGVEFYNVVPEGTVLGQNIEFGSGSSIEIGNIIPLGEIPSGAMVCNIELLPGDGGKIARSSGTFATVVSHTPDGTEIRLPSGKTKYINDNCRATIGVVSGGGRTDKPFLKAGAKVKWMKSKGHLYPVTKGVSMIAASHPHGGGRHRASSLKPTSVSRTSPPGQKVGLIAPRQSGRKKRRR